MSTPDVEAGAALHCSAHPGTITYLRCAQCAKPICPRCLVMTPVGAKCAACARARRLPTFQLSPLNVVVALLSTVILAVVLGGIGSIIVRLVPLAVMLFPFGAGLALGEAVSLVVNRKRHLILRLLVGAGVILSYIAMAIGDFLVHGPIELAQSGMLVPLILDALIGVVENPFIILFVICGIWIGIMRVG